MSSPDRQDAARDEFIVGEFGQHLVGKVVSQRPVIDLLLIPPTEQVVDNWC
jgi:hypothetical protein